jgi:hypothetical protein
MFLLYFLSVYLSGDYGIIPQVIIGEIRESYGDKEMIDWQLYSFTYLLQSPSGEW